MKRQKLDPQQAAVLWDRFERLGGFKLEAWMKTMRVGSSDWIGDLSHQPTAYAVLIPWLEKRISALCGDTATWRLDFFGDMYRVVVRHDHGAGLTSGQDPFFVAAVLKCVQALPLPGTPEKRADA